MLISKQHQVNGAKDFIGEKQKEFSREIKTVFQQHERESSF